MSRSSLFSEVEKTEWLQLFESQDLSAAAFCREYALPYSSFLSWRRTAEAAPRVPEFVELVSLPDADPDPDPDAGAAIAAGPLPLAELLLGNNLRLRLYETVAENSPRSGI